MLFNIVFLRPIMEKWFSDRLKQWYSKHKRDLPWRHETDPYKIWLSEIILQQTQVAQGMSYYLAFTKNYSNVLKLANASEDEVLKLWQGLGYYSRARNLHETAKKIAYELKGNFPSTYNEIRLLKGVGDYTASAIASFAFNLPFAVLDGNVYRLLSRLFGVNLPIDSASSKKEFQKLANSLLNKKEPALHNQAIMEFGSQFCKPKNPDCESCIFKNKCYAFSHKKVAELPVKKNKIKIRTRFFNYFVLIDKQGNVLINKRQNKDIWEGLYEFLLIETKNDCSEIEFLETQSFKALFKSKPTILYLSKIYKHVLSHQHLFARFYVIKCVRFPKSNSLKTPLNNIQKWAFPKLIDNFLRDTDIAAISNKEV